MPTRDYEFCKGNGEEVISLLDYVTSAKITARLVIVDNLKRLLNIAVAVNSYMANRILKDGKNYICLADFAQAGFEIGYNADTKIPSIANKPKELPITVNCKETTIEAVSINSHNFVPLLSIAAAASNFEVKFNNGKVEFKTK